MVNKRNKVQLKAGYLVLSAIFISNALSAGEWTFEPNLGLTETLTNNIELNQLDKVSSLVSQFIIGAEGDYNSKKLQLSFAGTQTYAVYSHDSEFDDTFQTLQADASYSLWQDNLKAIASTSTTNVSRSDTGNSLADLITADTVKQQNHSAGLLFNSGNSDYSLNSSLIYSMIETEDNIGESNGFSATVNTENGDAARHVFWDINGQFTNRENAGFTSKNHRLETKIGAITPYKINPFIRLYNEKVTGTLAGNNPDTIPSWGPGFRYQAAKHFIIDLSYNFVDKEITTSDDYIAADIDWQPSARTSLQAGYSKRFFGDSYELDFSHRTRRLTNTISYHETIEVFDRNNFAENTGGNPGDPPQDTPKEDNEFSLNKRLAWISTLALARTTFSLDVSTRERESLSTGIIDDYRNARFSITRRMNTRSDVTLYIDYRNNIFDKERPTGPRQSDIYKIFSTTYNKKLASSLRAFVTLQYLDRQSNFARYTYTEARASINLTKDF